MGEFYLKLSTSTWKRDQFNLFDYECKSFDQSEFKVNTSIQLTRALDRCSISELCQGFSEAQIHLLSIHKEKNRFDILQEDFSSIGMWKVVKYLVNYELKEDDIIKFGRETLIVKKICGKFPGKNFIVDVSPSPGEKSCKICCSDENEPKDPLVSLCKCSGSMKYTHYTCLKNWLKSKVTCNSIGKVSTYMWNKFICEVCKEPLPDFFSYNGEVLPLVEIEYPTGPYVLLEDTKEGRQTLYVIDIDENQKVLIGRESNCEIRLNDISVSRVHSVITYRDNRFYLLDNKSKFGTLVKMCKKISLGQGESADIQVGRTLVRMKVVKPWKCCFASKVVPEE